MARWHGLIDRELADTFVYVSAASAHMRYPVMTPEVADLVAAAEFQMVWRYLPASGLSVSAQTATGTCKITLADFMPQHEEMYTEAFLLARRVLNGERDLVRQGEHR